MTIILHITSRSDWEQAQRDGAYRAPSLESQGFIHFSKPEQVVDTANRFYRAVPDLMLLVVDPAKLQAEVRYEPPAEAPGDALASPGADAPGSDERFPHLYGALNLDAVIRAVDFPPDAGGGWSALPQGAK